MSGDRIRLVRDNATGVEAIRARFSAHAYDMHRHEDWLVGVTDTGVQQFFCRGARRSSTPGRVILMEPEEAHDGQSGGTEGFAYQMLYLPQAWLKTTQSSAPTADLGFAESLCDDPPLARAIRNACRALAEGAERLTRDAALDAVARRLAPHLGRQARAPGENGRDLKVARRARERLCDDITADPGADALAEAAGATDRFQLARAFRAAYGAAPHAYLVQIRLLKARRMLAAGARPAEAAADCGFTDQSHMGRWFRRAYGLTPAGYRALCTGVPDAAATA